jgi:hypothetical protein
MINQRLSSTKSRRFLFPFVLAFGLTSAFPLALPAATETETEPAISTENMATLHESRPLVARTGAWQTYNDHIHLKPGQEKRKVLLTFINGADGRKPLTDVHLLLARKPFATMKDFDGSGKLTRNLTGTTASGDTLLTVQVFGPSGARLAWKLLAEKATITAVDPNPFSLSDKLTVRGNNFSDHPHAVKAYIGDHAVSVVSANSTELQLKLPSHLSSGQQDLVVVVDTARSDPFKVTAKAGPEVTWVDHMSTAPGQPLLIVGKNFSPVVSENTVTFGSIRAHVLSATETRINCIVPEMHFPKWHVPITVTTNGAASKRKGMIDIDIRVIPSETDPPI